MQQSRVNGSEKRAQETRFGTLRLYELKKSLID